jgi:hypothetical protein
VSDIYHRHVLSDGSTIWIQKIGRKYLATKIGPEWLAIPEHSPLTTKIKALDYILEWLSNDILEIES